MAGPNTSWKQAQQDGPQDHQGRGEIMMNYGQNQYRKTQVATVDRGRLIVLLYEGAISFLTKARASLASGDIPTTARRYFLDRFQLGLTSPVDQEVRRVEACIRMQKLKPAPSPA